MSSTIMKTQRTFWVGTAALFTWGIPLRTLQVIVTVLLVVVCSTGSAHLVKRAVRKRLRICSHARENAGGRSIIPKRLRIVEVKLTKRERLRISPLQSPQDQRTSKKPACHPMRRSANQDRVYQLITKVV